MQIQTKLNKLEDRMESNKEFIPKAPDYSGEGLSIWKGTDKNGKTFLKCKKPEWNKSICCFKVEPKPKEEL